MEVGSVGTAVRQSLDRGRLLDELTGLVAVETPSQDATASATIAARLAERWSRLGTVRVEETVVGTHLVVEVPGAPHLAAAAPVVLLGHSDTVWPIGTLAAAVPLRVEPDVVAGPGTYDMKSGLVVMLTAVEALVGLGLPFPPLRVVIAADEEVGSGSATDLVRAACAGAAAVLGFESPHPDGSLKVGRLGSTRLRLRVVGREAHAALDPEAGVSAIEELIDQLGEVRGAVAAISRQRPGEVLYNVGAISGGGRTNVVPAIAEALIGLRFGTAAAEADVLAAFTALVPRREGAVLESDVLSARPAWQASPADERLLAEVALVGEALGQPLSGRPAAGAADTNTSGSMGIPTLDGFGPRGGGAHATGEHVLIDSLLDRVVLLAALLTHFDSELAS